MNSNRILITGANGFIAKNLCKNKFIIENFKVLKFLRSSNLDDLENYVSESSIILHLAGENRPLSNDEFYKNNFQLTKIICNFLIKNKLNTPIIFSSTVHVKLNNDYGRTKKLAENELKKLSISNGNPVSILRLPGVFGKWSKPNYNSVVSTFCHNIANDKECIISDSNKEIDLIYIDDVIKVICGLIKKKKKSIDLVFFDKYSYKIKLNALYDKLYQFNKSRLNCLLVNLVKGINKKLYSTFLSYLPTNKMTYSLLKNKDERGNFFEIFKEKNGSQLSIFTANKGFTRGGHFHNTKVEKFLVVSGKAKFTFKDLNTSKKTNFILNENDYKVIESIPGYWHEVENLGVKELKIIVWANEVYKKKNDDTYR